MENNGDERNKFGCKSIYSILGFEDKTSWSAILLSLVVYGAVWFWAFYIWTI
ncbi:MAG TPA: hypothetical protein QGF04_02010 [Woeseiaceae bacterium]|nr:hypothetical protein [Woeseiaceae bacterium]|tara:strand:- start:2985 stop:3140 length:156 start_codon:yes stop_codon:yes gene_type:complete